MHGNLLLHQTSESTTMGHNPNWATLCYPVRAKTPSRSTRALVMTKPIGVLMSVRVTTPIFRVLLTHEFKTPTFINSTKSDDASTPANRAHCQAILSWFVYRRRAEPEALADGNRACHVRPHTLGGARRPQGLPLLPCCPCCPCYPCPCYPRPTCPI